MMNSEATENYHYNLDAYCIDLFPSVFQHHSFSHGHAE